MDTHASGTWAACLALAGALLAGAGPAHGWGEDGHAIVTHLAIDALPPTMPDWLRTPDVRARLVYLSSEPDRWRGQQNRHVAHATYPDHYIDEEKLLPYGLSLKNLPPLRRQLTDLLAARRALHPEKFEKRDPEKDADYTQLSPGLLPYRIAESQWKIAASWTQLKTYERYRDRVSASMIDNARQNIVYHMGILSHFVADGAQPLHLTHHHHGWIGDNPKGYTREHGFHRYVDSGVIRDAGISYDGLRGRPLSPRAISQTAYWSDICAYLYETFSLVEPLYALEKSGKLGGQEGKRFIEERLLAGASALSGIWAAAYEGAHIDPFRVGRLKARDGREPGRAPRPKAAAVKASR